MNAGVRQVRRNVRNVVHNYTDAQVKVREATSNDPWGPSSTLMSQIAEYSHNMVAFTDIMQMIWRRLNDHGKNWRHVYKALVLMDYLIKTGNERVAQQCRENIFAIETLKDFQHYEENTDHGRAIRERAKQLVSLLQDDERLAQERQRALKARDRFLESSQSAGAADAMSPTSPGERSVDGARGAPDLEMARPQTSGEEELQLQLAIAMSQEEAERERQRSRSDEVRLQMALKQSEQDVQPAATATASSPGARPSAMSDLLSLDLGGPAAAAPPPPAGVVADPWGLPAPAAAKPAQAAAPPVDPWGMPVQPEPAVPAQSDPWSGTSTPAAAVDPWAPLEQPAAPAGPPAAAAPVDPWAPLASPSAPAAADPWAPVAAELSAAVQPPAAARDEDEFAELTQRSAAAPTNGAARGAAGSPWELGELSAALTPSPVAGAPAGRPPPASKSPHSFLGENSGLVNLDNLIGAPAGAAPPPAAQANPFGWTPAAAAANPFQAAAPPAPSINQIRHRRFEDTTKQPPAQPQPPTDPWAAPASAANPFLS
ncbi:epsin-1-like isoform X2 [Amphibalanus amphitrite]|uniref:epsin-1-like isoform X1 n=1 Tax=Amphibalanus amphitrite TaxID=1232801 RepID=UPI001C9107D9|nr:epsin-1-like isoform X1 [Amphibalanus amphitrite]XP_043191090.1 epsin-1-like isoform X2 [Amphibalanus amphitrite]